VYLGSLFFLLSLTLAVLIGHKNKKISMLAAKTPVAKVEASLPVEPKKEPETPKSLSEELPKEPTPAKEVTPAPQPAPADTAPAKEVTPTPQPAETAPATPETPAGTQTEKAGEP